MNNEFENYLANCLNYVEDGRIKEAMLYSLLAGGKRVRPNLLFAILDDFEIDKEEAFPIAAAIEMIHTYSLIHDDLPAMDNDDYRRGKLTNHKKYDQATAILAGDALLTEAFYLIANSNYDALTKSNIVLNVSRCAGVNGMIKGQEIDIYQKEGFSLLKQDELKTGCLLALPLICGAIIADEYNYIEELEKIGLLFGIIFQIQDDILAVSLSAEEFGKSNINDLNENKKTYVSEYGIDRCQSLIDEYYKEIKELTNEIKLENTLAYLEGLKGRKK